MCSDDGDTSFYVEDDENLFGGITLPPANMTNLDKINELLKTDETVPAEHKEILAGVIVKEVRAITHFFTLVYLFTYCFLNFIRLNTIISNATLQFSRTTSTN